MRILDFIPAQVTSISITGLSKNAGKTTVLGQLLQEYYEAGRNIGVVSIGVDGERYDAWSGLTKPAVHVEPGMLVATSRLALEESEARFEILEKIKDSSIGHEVYLVRTIKGGRIKLAGTPSLHEIRDVLRGFTYYGADICLVDGAYDRMSSSNPEITSGTILVVGAAYHRSLSVIVQHLQEWIFRYTIPCFLPEREKLRKHVNQPYAIWASEDLEEAQILSSPLLSGWSKGLTGSRPHLFLPGACSGTILKEAGSMEHPPIIVLRDSTKLFAKWEEIVAFYRQGGELRVTMPTKLLGVAVNPYSPDGYTFDGDEMLEQVKHLCRDVPVFDIFRDKLLR